MDSRWLLTAAAKAGKSPLQHFHAMWANLSASGKPFELIQLTNRGFDHQDPILGKFRDLITNKVRTDDLRRRTPASRAGKERQQWAVHLGISEDELLAFLGQVTWRHANSEPAWDELARLLMHKAGLRADTEAITVGKALVRSWVTTGAGPQKPDAIRRQIADRNLLARSGTLTFAVHAIDHQPSSAPANVELDFTALFEGAASFARRQLKDPSNWQHVIMPELRRAARALEEYGPAESTYLDRCGFLSGSPSEGNCLTCASGNSRLTSTGSSGKRAPSRM